jgi:3-oxoacyl-[acyl-carrier-protein] synthase II
MLISTASGVVCRLQSYAVQVNYINAHATSTLVGDIAEIKAVKSAFPDTKHLKVNGTKSMIGHCLGAAGGMEAIATLKAIETGWVHPTLNQVGASAVCWPAAL